MSVDVDVLTSGMAAMAGTNYDAQYVLLRINTAIQSMITFQQSLGGNQNLASDAAQTWPATIDALAARYTELNNEVSTDSASDTTGTSPSTHWSDVQVLAIDVANSSNTLEDVTAAAAASPTSISGIASNVSGAISSAATALTSATGTLGGLGGAASGVAELLVVLALFAAAFYVYVEVKKA